MNNKNILTFLFLAFSITPAIAKSWQNKHKPTRRVTSSTRSHDEPTLNSVWDILQQHVLKYPDNINRTNVTISGVTLAAAAAAYFTASKILDIPVVGRALQAVGKDGLKLVDPKDLIEGLSFVVGVSAVLGLYQNAMELRQKFFGSFMSILMARQVSEPHTVGEKEVMESALQALALLHLLGTAEDLVTPIVEKTMRHAMRNIERENRMLEEQYDY